VHRLRPRLAPSRHTLLRRSIMRRLEGKHSGCSWMGRCFEQGAEGWASVGQGYLLPLPYEAARYRDWAVRRPDLCIWHMPRRARGLAEDPVRRVCLGALRKWQQMELGRAPGGVAVYMRRRGCKSVCQRHAGSVSYVEGGSRRTIANSIVVHAAAPAGGLVADRRHAAAETRAGQGRAVSPRGRPGWG